MGATGSREQRSVFLFSCCKLWLLFFLPWSISIKGFLGMDFVFWKESAWSDPSGFPGTKDLGSRNSYLGAGSSGCDQGGAFVWYPVSPSGISVTITFCTGHFSSSKFGQYGIRGTSKQQCCIDIPIAAADNQSEFLFCISVLLVLERLAADSES